MEDRNHSFSVAEATKYGIEKAILLSNIRFWLDKNKANEKNIHRHTDGKEYYWTYNSARAWGKLFPYMSQDKISRLIREMESEGIIICGFFSNNRYDRTKYVSMMHFEKIQNGESKNPKSSYTDLKQDTVEYSVFFEKEEEEEEPHITTLHKTPRFFTNARRADAGKPPLQPKRSDKQREVTKALQLIDYFKKKFNENHGICPYFTGSPSENSKMVRTALGVVRVVGEETESYIDWWFREGGEWASYDPRACFSSGQVEKWQASKVIKKKKNQEPLSL